MSELMVLGFETEADADRFGFKLEQMQKDMIVQLDDAAEVVRDLDGKPHVKHGHSMVGAGAMGGAFWGMLFGLIFLIPFLGLAGDRHGRRQPARPGGRGDGDPGGGQEDDELNDLAEEDQGVVEDVRDRPDNDDSDEEHGGYGGEAPQRGLAFRESRSSI
jgi:hypothetical protein